MVTNTMEAGPTRQETTLAALAHACIILQVPGLAGSLLIWAANKAKSEFVRRHAMQAWCWQLAVLVVFWLACGVVFGLAVFRGVTGQAPGAPSPFSAGFWGEIATATHMWAGLWAFSIVVAFLGAIFAARGKQFSYPLVGLIANRIDRRAGGAPAAAPPTGRVRAGRHPLLLPALVGALLVGLLLALVTYFSGTRAEGYGRSFRQVAEWDKRLAANPKDAQAHFGRGVAYLKMELYRPAIADFDDVLALRPDSAAGYANRGCAHDGARDYDKAIADFDRALALDPTLRSVYWNRALTWAHTGESERRDADIAQYSRLHGETVFGYAIEPDDGLATSE
jgi:uncharacterized Tic20 family protein